MILSFKRDLYTFSARNITMIHWYTCCIIIGGHNFMSLKHANENRRSLTSNTPIIQADMFGPLALL